MTDQPQTAVSAMGFLDCAIRTKDGDYFPAMISDDSDGVSRLYVDQSTRFRSSSFALTAASITRKSRSYRSWSNRYKLVEIGHVAEAVGQGGEGEG